MKTSGLILASFRHYWRSHLGLLFGAFLASAILSGSLLVGDSVRASLSRAAQQRLGKVQAGILGGDRWFTEDLATKTGAAPLILLRGSVGESTGMSRANAVQILGVDEAFWKLGPESNLDTPFRNAANTADKSVRISTESTVLNESLARRLGVKVGDTVLVRLEKPSAISRDAPLSGEANQDVTLRRKVTAIVSGEDFGNFQLQASQTAPDNVFLPLAELAEVLGKKGKVNGLVHNGSTQLVGQFSDEEKEWLKQIELDNLVSFSAKRLLDIRLERYAALSDFSLKLTRLSSKSEPPTSDLRLPASGWDLTTDRVFLDEVIAQRVLQAIPGSRGVLTYLVNGISSAKGRAPYSMVTAVGGGQGSTVKGQEGNPGLDDSVTVNQWLADDLQLAVGDRLDIRYFTVGLGRELKEQTAGFTVRGILPMTDPAVNPSWAPDFPGVTDAKNCRDWQPGIPMKLDTIRDQDEAYWKQYKTTPKAFISLAAGQKLWANRFGNLTAIRFPDTGQDVSKLGEELGKNLRLADIGLVPRDFQAEAMAAAKGSVDFGGLFVGLSLFIIASSLIFSCLLFLFTLEKRVAQIGLLFSIGWREKQVRRLILWEAGLVAVIGAGLGLFGGLVYTKIAVAGLNSIWSGATAGMKLVHSFQPQTLVIAFVSSLAASLGTLWLASRHIFKTPAKDLLVGDAWARTDGIPVGRLQPTDDTSVAVPRSRFAGLRARFLLLLPVLCLILAVALSVFGSRATNPQTIAGLFFGAGFLLLIAGLLLIRRQMGASIFNPPSTIRMPQSLAVLGLRNITRRPGRSLAVIGMMAGGIFLVIAVNAFRLGAEADSTRRDSGTGGFALIGDSTLPVYEDLNTETAWDAFALDDNLMKQVNVVPFRVREGDDASCLNLNKAQRPVLCAVNPKLLAERKAFAFAKGSWHSLGENLQSPISNLQSDIPAIADQATAMWGLGKGVGDTIAYTDAQGREFNVKLVALLAGSVLQGKLIISEQAFLEKYPDATGYKFFLIDAPSDQVASVRAHLTKQLEIRGLALESAVDRLAAFNAVQNTYIGIFTVLGGLGVLLGTAGLGVLAMRNVLERRGEFGLMQALGFKPGALRGMVLTEHAALLVGGLLLGLLSAFLAVWPNVKQSGGALPVGFLLWLNLGILGFGIAACWLAAVMALCGRLLDAVRRE